MHDLSWQAGKRLSPNLPQPSMSHDLVVSRRGPVLAGAIAVLAIYGFAWSQGWPQHATALVVDATSHEAHDQQHVEDVETGQSHLGEFDSGQKRPEVFAVIPFVILLACIAVLPLLRSTEHWWESNLHRFYVAAGLGAITLLYYALLYHGSIEQHWPAHDLLVDAPAWQVAWTVLANALLGEYIPFIMLLFSLYTISGGIRIEGDLRAHPLTNTAFIATGGLLASFVGTTGAAMLLIRPLLETNSERRYVRHTVIFFIFVVCNCGGCLLPIGDPPLFLGYLRGVPFLWTMTALWAPWLVTNLLLLAIYYLWDRTYCYPREEKTDILRDEIRTRKLRISGLALNGPLLLGVIVSVALLDPSKAFPGTTWHAPMYLREIAQLALVALSLALGGSLIRQQNRFNYAAIVEVAALFFGIFICMQPALQILNVEGGNLGVNTPTKFFWFTGGLSSVLDNAPTYVVFFETAKTVPLEDAHMVPVAGGQIAEPFLIAISLGAVFLGAMTYIGNGPNFMVRAIAEKSGVRMPSFFGYMAYSVLVLLPVFAVTSYLFLVLLA